MATKRTYKELEERIMGLEEQIAGPEPAREAVQAVRAVSGSARRTQTDHGIATSMSAITKVAFYRKIPSDFRASLERGLSAGSLAKAFMKDLYDLSKIDAG